MICCHAQSRYFDNFQGKQIKTEKKSVLYGEFLVLLVATV